MEARHCVSQYAYYSLQYILFINHFRGVSEAESNHTVPANLCSHICPSNATQISQNLPIIHRITWSYSPYPPPPELGCCSIGACSVGILTSVCGSGCSDSAFFWDSSPCSSFSFGFGIFTGLRLGELFHDSRT
jgi:hypothetical protein